MGRTRWLSENLAQAGIASFFWDKRGVGQSTGGDRNPGDPPGYRDQYTDVMTDVQDAESALRILARRPEIDAGRIAVMGHSAGVYFSCLLAERTTVPATYLFSGGVCCRVDHSLGHMFDLTRQYISRNDDNRAWVRNVNPGMYWYAHHWPEVLDAIRNGQDVFVREHQDFTFRLYIRRHSQELSLPRDQQFRHVRVPALVMHGEYDLFVPPKNATMMADHMRDAGNDDVTVLIVPRTGHGWEIYPAEQTKDQLLRQLLSGSNLEYPFSMFYLHAIIGWLQDRFRMNSAAAQ